MAINNDALIEIAKSVMETKSSPQKIQTLAEEVFKIKGIKFNEKSEEYAQFVIDFMLCGDFIASNDEDEPKWDLKYRQPKSLQDREGDFIIHNEEAEEEVSKNEMKDEDEYREEGNYAEEEEEDDDDDKKEDKDEIEENLEELGYKVVNEEDLNNLDDDDFKDDDGDL